MQGPNGTRQFKGSPPITKSFCYLPESIVCGRLSAGVRKDTAGDPAMTTIQQHREPEYRRTDGFCRSQYNALLLIRRLGGQSPPVLLLYADGKS